MRSEMGVGRGAANSQEVPQWPGPKGRPPRKSQCTASGEGGILRHRITIRPQVLAKEVSQVLFQPPRPALWTPKILKKPRVRCASGTAARSSARGKSPGPGLRCENLRQARRRSPRPRVTSTAGSQPRPPLRGPRRHPAASCLGPFRVGAQARSVTSGHRSPSGKLKAFPPSRLRSGTGFERYFI